MTTDIIVDISDNAKSYIPVDSTTRLYMSPRNWQLYKRVMNKGVERYVLWRTYTKLDNAINDIIHLKVANETFKDIDKFRKAYNKVVLDISKALAPKYKVEEL